ncbi:uncharacterized protein MAM_06472 [Metarhizium album ARSEF 1941]|uniref:CID domain-containing protein n=1 Tax=Metarhizium album (strain ARSEF 1941) TaxID=1081103 RepID=A0A0B2WHX9_METAS|nr:uncharacterized protein MAM_06472 [Metarhizium album ARSEF 1941]KHN95631.1 hypothetical protein MAM_06472 [Metarhizium album ARSEF 1941]
MATPEIAIAKAALAASLFRADPASISRPSVDSFFQQVASTLTQCSRPNVQACKDYILGNIVHSSGRSSALAKYLVALSNAQVDDAAHARPSTKRRRLHVLYIVNDVLHHAARLGNQDFRAAVEAYLPPLVSSAASFDKCPKHIKKIQDLISLWKSKQYSAEAVIPKLQEALAGSSTLATPQPVNPSLQLAKEAPFTLPSFHGDSSTAWYDLPAATWLPHLVANSTKPMLPDLIRPVQLAPGPADRAITAAVKSLLADAERLFSRDRRPDDNAHVDVNEMGERIILDEMTGEKGKAKGPVRVSIIISTQLFAHPKVFITILQTQTHITFQKPQPWPQPQPQPQQKLHTSISLAITNPQPQPQPQSQSQSQSQPLSPFSKTISSATACIPFNSHAQYPIRDAHPSPTSKIHRTLAAAAPSPSSTRLDAGSCPRSPDDERVERTNSSASPANPRTRTAQQL